MNVGGVSVVIAGLMENIDSDQFSIVTVTGDCEDNEIELPGVDNLPGEIIRVKSLKRSLGVLSDFKSIIDVWKIITRVKPQIVHTHTSKAGVVGRIASLIASRDIVLVHTYHGHLLYGYYSKLISSFIVIVERLLARHTSKLIADSSQVKKDLMNIKIGHEDKWLVISPGIRNTPVLEKNKCRSILKYHNKEKIICWIGRFTDIKNPFLALDSFEIISHGMADCRLVMVGGGHLLESVRIRALKDDLKVEFTGWLPDPSIYLCSADLLLLTSKNEGFGLVLAEAGWYGIPSLSTNVGGVNEFIIDNDSGFLVNEDKYNIADKAISVLSNTEFLAEVGKRASILTKKRFTALAFTKNHEALYQTLIN
jgi:glycosyltransferase involved in cell wall biosynthesis